MDNSTQHGLSDNKSSNKFFSYHKFRFNRREGLFHYCSNFNLQQCCPTLQIYLLLTLNESTLTGIRWKKFRSENLTDARAKRNKYICLLIHNNFLLETVLCFPLLLLVKIVCLFRTEQGFENGLLSLPDRQDGLAWHTVDKIRRKYLNCIAYRLVCR